MPSKLQTLLLSSMSMPLIIPIKEHNWKEPGSVDKFGFNPGIDTGTDPEDVWAFGGIYTFLSAATTHYISSDNELDDVGLDITVEGLDSDWNAISRTTTLDATDARTFIAINTDMIRVNRAFNDNGKDFTGNIYVSSDNTDANSNGVPDDTSTIKAFIIAGDNQTLQAIYSVPAATTLYLFIWATFVLPAAAINKKTANASFRIREFGKVFRVRDKDGVESDGLSSSKKPRTIALPIPAKSDVLVRCEEVAQNSTQVGATFEGLLLPDG